MTLFTPDQLFNAKYMEDMVLAAHQMETVLNSSRETEGKIIFTVYNIHKIHTREREH